MELGFITKAMRRFWWVVVLFALLGVTPGLLSNRGSAPKYESEALVLISPSSASLTESSSGGADRYILGQLVVFQSISLAERVATQMANGVNPAILRQSVTFAQIPSTDIVRIVAISDSPEVAKAMADGYVDTYFEAIRAQVDEAQKPEVQGLTDEIDRLKREIAKVDKKIVAALEPFIPVGPVDAQAVIPTIDQIAPDLAFQKAVLSDQYLRILGTRDELVLTTRLRVTSQIIQRATLSSTPTTGSGTIKIVAGLFGGLLLGAVGSVLVSRLLGVVLDEDEISESLEVGVVGSMPRERTLGRHSDVLSADISEESTRTIDQLCVRAEAAASLGSGFTIAVVGAQRSAGSTTVAAAMARLYADNGAQVLLIDADVRDPDLTRRYGSRTGGIPALLALMSAEPRSRRSAAGRLDPFASTSIPGLRIVGLGDKGTTPIALPRETVDSLVATAATHARVVIFDAGALMDAASTLQLTTLVDAVVVAMPLRRLRARALKVVAHQLREIRGVVLPVVTSASHNERRAAEDFAVPALAESADVVESGASTPAGKSPTASQE